MYIQIDASTEKEEDFEDWAGFVESKYALCGCLRDRLRLLSIFISKGISVTPYPKRLSIADTPLSVRFVLGLSLQRNVNEIDLSYEMNSFIDILRLFSFLD